MSYPISDNEGYKNIKKITIEPKRKYVYITVKQGKIEYTYKHKRNKFSYEMTFYSDNFSESEFLGNKYE